jgi:hypothetical protein
MMSLPNQQGVKTVSVMGKPGGSQLLNSTTGQILALPGNTQTMMIGRNPINLYLYHLHAFVSKKRKTHVGKLPPPN